MQPSAGIGFRDHSGAAHAAFQGHFPVDVGQHQLPVERYGCAAISPSL